MCDIYWSLYGLAGLPFGLCCCFKEICRGLGVEMSTFPPEIAPSDVICLNTCYTNWTEPGQRDFPVGSRVDTVRAHLKQCRVGLWAVEVVGQVPLS